MRRLVFEAPTMEGYVLATIVQDGTARDDRLVGDDSRTLSAAAVYARAHDPSDPVAMDAARSLLVRGAHEAFNRDLLITESPWVFDSREYGTAKYGNPRRILDAARIVGLFLRSRDCYVYWVDESGSRESLDRGLFYWVLARHRTPHMWRYHSACHVAGKIRSDDTGSLGYSVMMRCDRALQARDWIAERFYGRSDRNVHAELMYHFDYLTLLLVGALDAQARVAHRAYDLRGDESRAGFRRQRFLGLLREAAPPLHRLVTEPRTIHFLTMLHTLRNTIHGAPLPGFTVRTDGSVSTIDVEEGKVATVLTNACNGLGLLGDWGLRTQTAVHGTTGVRHEWLCLEPYTLAEALVRECLGLVDAIAAVTDVDRLFMGQPVPSLLSEPPEDPVFNRRLRERLALLA